jgi:hypothetical protein
LSSAPQTPTLPAPTPPTLPRPGAAGASRSVLGKVKRTILAEPSDAAVTEPPRGKRGRPRKAPADAQPAVAVPPSAEDILSVQQCAGVLRCFFEFTTHFVSGEGDVQPIVHGLLKSVFAMMPRSMAADAQTARFFDPTVAADGLRFLPLLPQESTPASGVELHRRALALEQRVSQLVRLLRGVGADKLNAEDARDLDVAARCCDALDGTGVLPAPPPDSPTRAAGLHALLQAVHRARAGRGAEARDPHRGPRHVGRPGAAHSLPAARGRAVRQRRSDQAAARGTQREAGQGPATRHAAAEAVRVAAHRPRAPAEAADGAGDGRLPVPAQPRPAGLQPRPPRAGLCAGGPADQRGQRGVAAEAAPGELHQICEWACWNVDGARPHADARAPRQVQDSLMGSAQRHLGMPDIQRSPAILQAEALTLAICRRMADDTHSERRTRHLYPSPSLETATYRPGEYL